MHLRLNEACSWRSSLCRMRGEQKSSSASVATERRAEFMASDGGGISVEEFTRLQGLFLEERQTAYELKEQVKLLKNDVISKSKKSVEFSNLQKERDVLLHNLEASKAENIEQQQVLRASIKSIHESNNQLNQELEKIKKEVQEKTGVIKMRDEESRKMQADMARMRRQQTETEDKLVHRVRQVEYILDQLDVSSNAESPEKPLKTLVTELRESSFTKVSQKQAPVDLKRSGQLKTEAFNPLQTSDDPLSQDPLSPSQDPLSQDPLSPSQDPLSPRESHPPLNPLSSSPPSDASSSHQADPLSPALGRRKGNEDTEEIKNRVRKLEEEKGALEAEIEKWKEKTKMRQTSLTKMQQDHEEKMNQLKKEREEQVEQIVTKHKQNIEAREAEAKNLQELIKKYVRTIDIDRLKEETKKAGTEKDRFEEELKMVHEDREHIISKLSEKSLRIDELRDELAMEKAMKKSQEENAEKEMNALKSTIQGLQNDMSALNQNKASVDTNAGQLKEEINKYTKEIAALQEKIASTEQRMRENDEGVKIKMDQIAAYKESILHLNEDINRMQEDSKEMKSKMDNYFGLWNDTRKALEDEMERNRISEERVIQLTSRVEELEEKLEEANIRLEATRASRDRFKENLTTVSDEKRELEERMENIVAERDQLVKERDELLSDQSVNRQDIETAHLQIEELSSRGEEMEQKMKQMEEELKDSIEKKEQAEIALKDSITEQRIAEKKQAQFQKDLKQQTVKERREYEKRIEDLSAELQLATTTAPKDPRLQLAKGNRMMSSTPNLHSTLSNSNNSSPEMRPKLFDASVISPPAPMTSLVDVLQDDITALAMEKGKLISDKVALEEKLRNSEDEIQKLSAELSNKETIIRDFVAKSKVTGRASEEMDKDTTAKVTRSSGFWGFGRDKDLDQERYNRMEAVLQDTMLRNIQLQNDVVTLGNEIARLHEEHDK
ncbi:trichohyalin [Planoprotostelium fungivorum]|uniref:Trichohyalin n=1 Tax=Planoprotostelium fungivorum TaxID=1890364 RepID=A0A2P6NTB8_9EUKA|nr:trichohyalin [Planoprotostelium fungivorum]